MLLFTVKLFSFPYHFDYYFRPPQQQQVTNYIRFVENKILIKIAHAK